MEQIGAGTGSGDPVEELDAAGLAETATLLGVLAYGRRPRHRLAVGLGALGLWLGFGFGAGAVLPGFAPLLPVLPISVAVYAVAALLTAWGLGAGDGRRAARWLPVLVLGTPLLLLGLALLASVPAPGGGESRGPGPRESARRRAAPVAPDGHVAPPGAASLLPSAELAARLLGGTPVATYDVARSRGVLTVTWTLDRARLVALVRPQREAADRIRAGNLPAHGRRRQELAIGDAAYVEVREGRDGPVAAAGLAAVGAWVAMIRLWTPEVPPAAERAIEGALETMVGGLEAGIARLPTPPRW